MFGTAAIEYRYTVTMHSVGVAVRSKFNKGHIGGIKSVSYSEVSLIQR